MARYELSIYGEDDEVLKKYETDHVRWGVFLRAVELQEEIKDKENGEQFAAINEFIKSIFVGLTDEDLEKADGLDVVHTFQQLVSAVGKIKGGNSKNA